MITIPLTQKQITYVDDMDKDLADYTWSAQFKKQYSNGGKYIAIRSIGKKFHQKSELLHRVVLSRALNRELLSSELVDHKDLDTLNNTRSNLRLANHIQNKANRDKPSNNTSGYKGVSKSGNKWMAIINTRYIGTFDTPQLAAIAYNLEAEKLYGEFARLNEV